MAIANRSVNYVIAQNWALVGRVNSGIVSIIPALGEKSAIPAGKGTVRSGLVREPSPTWQKRKKPRVTNRGSYHPTPNLDTRAESARAMITDTDELSLCSQPGTAGVAGAYAA